MVVCRKTWCYFEVQKVKVIGGIHLPTAGQLEKEEVLVKGIGPDVKEIKIGDKVIVVPKDLIRYEDPEGPIDEMRGFVKEEDVVALIVDKKK